MSVLNHYLTMSLGATGGELSISGGIEVRGEPRISSIFLAAKESVRILKVVSQGTCYVLLHSIDAKASSVEVFHRDSLDLESLLMRIGGGEFVFFPVLIQTGKESIRIFNPGLSVIRIDQIVFERN